MRVRYILTAEDLVVHGDKINSLTLDWNEEGTKGKVMEYSQKWITSRNFLTSRMVGLIDVGECSLTIEPFEEGEVLEEESQSRGFDIENPDAEIGISGRDWADSFMSKHNIPRMDRLSGADDISH